MMFIMFCVLVIEFHHLMMLIFADTNTIRHEIWWTNMVHGKMV